MEHARQRFVRDGGLALPERGDVDATVLVVWCDVDHALDVGLALQHLAVVFVRPNPFRRPAMLAVIRLHDLPGDVTAGADAGIAVAPRRLVEEAADPRAITESLPVNIVLTVAVGIDHGDELEVGPGDHAGIHLALGLRAASHLGQQDHVAWRNDAAAPEYAPRDDRERRSGRNRFEKIPSIHARHRYLPA